MADVDRKHEGENKPVIPFPGAERSSEKPDSSRFRDGLSKEQAERLGKDAWAFERRLMLAVLTRSRSELGSIYRDEGEGAYLELLTRIEALSEATKALGELCDTALARLFLSVESTTVSEAA